MEKNVFYYMEQKNDISFLSFGQYKLLAKKNPSKKYNVNLSPDPLQFICAHPGAFIILEQITNGFIRLFMLLHEQIQPLVDFFNVYIAV